MDPEGVVVLLGNTGVGKSATGNTILGETAFESKRSFKSVTTKISEETRVLFGRRITVVDTPGILVPGLEEELRSYCERLQRSRRPCLLLVVVKVDRFTEEQLKAVEAAMRVVGKAGLRNSLLLFTGKDILDGLTLQQFISDDPDGPLLGVAKTFGDRVYTLNNKDGERNQVQELLTKKWPELFQNQPAPREDVLSPAKQRSIVLLGRPGSGKSSAGNTLLGFDKFPTGCDFESVTTQSVCAKSELVPGYQLKVVDTPGFGDGCLKRKALFNEIVEAIGKVSPGPHALVFVVRLGRVSPADAALLRLLPQLLGPDTCRFCAVVFTHGDELKDKPIKNLIQSNQDVAELVSACGGRFCVFDNRNSRKRQQQVGDLLRSIDQIYEANGGSCFTSEMMKLKTDPSLWKKLFEIFCKILDSLKELFGCISPISTATVIQAT